MSILSRESTHYIIYECYGRKLHTKSSSWDTPGACGVGVPTGASRNSGGRSEPDEALIPSSSPTAGANWDCKY